MDLHKDPIRTRGDTRSCHGCHQIPLARAVTGVHNDRKVAQLFENGNGTEIKGIPCSGLKGPDTPLAEDDIMIPLRHDILSRHQEFFYCSRKPPLEDHRLIITPYLCQEPEILHIPCTDLDHICILIDHLDITGIHELSHDQQPCLLPRLSQIFKALKTKPLEGIGRGPGFKRPAPDKTHPLLLDLPCNLQQHLPVLYGTGACNDLDLLPADRHPIDMDNGILRMELPACQLVWLENGDNLLHPGECGKGQLLQYPLIPDGAENRTLFSAGDMDSESKPFQTLLDMPDLLFGGVRPEYDDHKISSFISLFPQHLPQCLWKSPVLFRESYRDPQIRPA